MKQNKYDDPEFFSAYQKMSRSINGLEAAGEWHVFRSLLPDLRYKHVLDLGCGYGWHCRYVREQQASSVVGVDLSEKMLKKAREQTHDPAITYTQMAVEDIAFANDQFDVVISSLAFHYVESFGELCQKIYDCLKPGGTFLFSVEHPIFTSRKEQDWFVDEQGNRLHWPVDNYQAEGMRVTSFLAENVIKYHRTIATYMNDVIQAGFVIKVVKEPMPPEEMVGDDWMKDEIRRPMFLMISAEKPHAGSLR
ncbi:SAM-dependent methyltransferase [Brevibacillus choshinensis]|uniref:SAM-dependent methyltransferase n=1 Tax=Brevibacillus choshinensis TaxID=54911 RepID=A0ABR5N4N3_BRECH|nr:class I SAM-dependent methyltransferase [Brevibacillus choshinensis]KQL45552.1 SAM-dependent methyltransferase [Brevibacillus choshinensis]